MDSMFFVNDDIDLSDDDFGIDLSKGTQLVQQNVGNNNGAKQPSTIATTTKPTTKSSIQTHTGLGAGPGLCNSKASPNKAVTVTGGQIKEKVTSKFFCDDDGDDLFDDLDSGDMDNLLSQIDLPAAKKKTSSLPHTNGILCTPKQTKPDKRTDVSANQESYFSNKSFPKNTTNQTLNKEDFCIGNKSFAKNIVGKAGTSSVSSDMDKNTSKDRPVPCFGNDKMMTPERRNTKQVPFRSSSSTSNQQRIQMLFEERTPCQTTVASRTPCRTTTASVSAHRNVTTTPMNTSSLTTPNVLSRSNNKRKSTSASHEKPRQRRFPGPAGMLPAMNSMTSLDQLKSPDIGKGVKRTLTPVTPKTPLEGFLSCSQDGDFDGAIWIEVQKTVSRMFPHRTCDPISKVLQEAVQNQLKNCKVAILCGLVKSFSIGGTGGKLTLKDPSGEIHGTVHNNVLEEYEPDLRAGTGLILKDVSVFSPNVRKHYANITPANIVQVFPAEIPEMLSTQTQCTQVQQNNNYNNDNSSSSKHTTGSSNNRNNNESNHNSNSSSSNSEKNFSNFISKNSKGIKNNNNNNYSNNNNNNNNNSDNSNNNSNSSNNNSNNSNNNSNNNTIININSDNNNIENTLDNRNGKENVYGVSRGYEKEGSFPGNVLAGESNAGSSGTNQALGFFDDDDSDEMILSCL